MVDGAWSGFEGGELFLLEFLDMGGWFFLVFFLGDIALYGTKRGGRGNKREQGSIERFWSLKCGVENLRTR